jgi:hypothetical protein
MKNEGEAVEKQEFVEKVSESLKQNNTLEFQKIFTARLQELLDTKLAQLKEEMDDPEMEAVTKIEVAAKGFGGGEAEYDEGVLVVTLRSKQAALEFSDWLEDCEYVDSYGMEVIHNEPLEGYSEREDIDIDSITDDRNFSFEFTIYLNPDLVQYDPYEYEEEPEEGEAGEEGEEGEEEIGESVEQIDEVTRVVKVNFKGKKRIKMQCQRGFKWNPSTKSCEKIGGAELATMRKAIRKELLTKKSKGSGFRKRVVRKMKKAMRYRKQMGLPV